MSDCKYLSETINKLLRVEEFPVGLKFVRNENELTGAFLAKKKLYSCQMLKIASQGGYVHAATKNELSCHIERFVYGMDPLEDTLLETEMHYIKTKDMAKNWFLEELPKTKCYGIKVGPLSKVNFTPDVIVLIVDAWQATRCIHAYIYEAGKNLQFVVGPNALPCAYGAVYVNNVGKPNLVPGCSGARAHAKFGKDDLAFFMPFQDADKFMNGLRETHKHGLSVPFFLSLGYPPKTAKSVFSKEK